MFGKKDKAQKSSAMKGATVKGGARKGATRKADVATQPIGTKAPSASPLGSGSKAAVNRSKKEALLKASQPKDGKKPGKLSKPSSLTTLLRYHRECLASSWSRLDHARLATVMTSALVAVSLTLPMLLLLIVSNLQQLSSGWEDQLSLSVYLKPEVSEVQTTKLMTQVQSIAAVEKAALISPEQGLEDFKNVAGAELLGLFEQNPLPAVIEVVPRVDTGSDDYQFQIAELVRALEAYPSVDEVSYDLQWVQRLVNYVGLAERFAVLIGVLLALGAVLAISNSIRLEIENRRQEIIVIKLVGGTDSFIRLPFLYSGFWYGVLGATLATICLWLIGWWLSPFVGRLLTLYSSNAEIDYLGLFDVFKLYFCSITLAVVGAWLAVYRHLDEIEPE
jgi:cell division transport system permease protein